MKNSKKIFVGYMGQAADGSYPKAGTLVRYRCQNCRELCEDKQPKPGRWLAFCKPCADAMKAALEST